MSAQEGLKTKRLDLFDSLNRLTYRVTGVLGLTTGIGVIAWGVWSLLTSLLTFVYEETGVTVEEILANNGLNEGLLLSAVVIALGVIILELKRIQDLMQHKFKEAEKEILK
ncbi:MAG: hypothetical protein AAF495_23875 [Pseudomonadota bacterium]